MHKMNNYMSDEEWISTAPDEPVDRSLVKTIINNKREYVSDGIPDLNTVLSDCDTVTAVEANTGCGKTHFLRTVASNPGFKNKILCLTSSIPVSTFLSTSLGLRCYLEETKREISLSGGGVVCTVHSCPKRLTDLGILRLLIIDEASSVFGALGDSIVSNSKAVIEMVIAMINKKDCKVIICDASLDGLMRTLFYQWNQRVCIYKFTNPVRTPPQVYIYAGPENFRYFMAEFCKSLDKNDRRIWLCCDTKKTAHGILAYVLSKLNIPIKNWTLEHPVVRLWTGEVHNNPRLLDTIGNSRLRCVVATTACSRAVEFFDDGCDVYVMILQNAKNGAPIAEIIQLAGRNRTPHNNRIVYFVNDPKVKDEKLRNLHEQKKQLDDVVDGTISIISTGLYQAQCSSRSFCPISYTFCSDDQFIDTACLWKRYNSDRSRLQPLLYLQESYNRWNSTTTQLFPCSTLETAKISKAGRVIISDILYNNSDIIHTEVQRMIVSKDRGLPTVSECSTVKLPADYLQEVAIPINLTATESTIETIVIADNNTLREIGLYPLFTDNMLFHRHCVISRNSVTILIPTMKTSSTTGSILEVVRAYEHGIIGVDVQYQIECIRTTLRDSNDQHTSLHVDNPFTYRLFATILYAIIQRNVEDDKEQLLYFEFVTLTDNITLDKLQERVLHRLPILNTYARTPCHDKFSPTVVSLLDEFVINHHLSCKGFNAFVDAVLSNDRPISARVRIYSKAFKVFGIKLENVSRTQKNAVITGNKRIRTYVFNHCNMPYIAIRRATARRIANLPIECVINSVPGEHLLRALTYPLILLIKSGECNYIELKNACSDIHSNTIYNDLKIFSKLTGVPAVIDFRVLWTPKSHDTIQTYDINI